MNNADFNAVKQIIDVDRFMHVGEPTFKPADQCLTAEGYPLGTTCWYVVVESFGKRKYCCGRTPTLALHVAAAYAESELAIFVNWELQKINARPPASGGSSATPPASSATPALPAS